MSLGHSNCFLAEANYQWNEREKVAGYDKMVGALREAVIAAIKNKPGVEPEWNTGGGTSNGHFIVPLDTEELELGLLNESTHKINEITRVDALGALYRVYKSMMLGFLV